MFNRDAKDIIAAQSGVMDAQKQLIHTLQQELAILRERHATCMAELDREITEARAEIKAAAALLEALGVDVAEWRQQRGNNAMWWQAVLPGLSANIEFSPDRQRLPVGEAGRQQADYLGRIAKAAIPQIAIQG